jgi:glycosyltransferase involved in cell wall biosynthesis
MSAEISVALCTHDGAAFIEEQLRSILAQSVLPGQIVLSDDGSRDDTIALAAAVIAASGHGVDFRVIRNEAPLGVARNFEQAILACSGEFVILSDQDDVWLPDRVAQALAVFESRPAVSLVHGDARLIDDGGASLHATLFEALGMGAAEVAAIHEGRGFELLVKRNLVTGATTMLRRALAEDAAPFPDGWLHDEWLAIVAAARGELDVVDAPLISYRQHGSNQVGVEKLSTAGKLGRMLEPGADRSARLLVRATALADRLPVLAPTRAGAAREKLAHERMRSALPAARAGRIVPVLRELRTGRYSTFGRGTADAARDLLQPLKGAK